MAVLKDGRHIVSGRPRYQRGTERPSNPPLIFDTPQVHESEPLPGDILVFLSGQEDIEALAQLLEEEKEALEAMEAGAGKPMGLVEGR